MVQKLWKVSNYSREEDDNNRKHTNPVLFIGSENFCPQLILWHFTLQGLWRVTRIVSANAVVYQGSNTIYKHVSPFDFSRLVLGVVLAVGLVRQSNNLPRTL